MSKIIIDLERLLTEKGISKTQCHLDKDDPKSSVCRNTYPALFYNNLSKTIDIP